MNQRATLLPFASTALSIALHGLAIFALVVGSRQVSDETFTSIPVTISTFSVQPESRPVAPTLAEDAVSLAPRTLVPKVLPKPKVLAKNESRPALNPVALSQVSSSNAVQGEQNLVTTETSDTVVVPSVEAQPIEQIKPKIPDELKTKEYKSYVRVKVEIRVDGSSVPTLKTSSGSPLVDERVLEALRTWRWRPALLDGNAVKSVRYFRFEFEVK